MVVTLLRYTGHVRVLLSQGASSVWQFLVFVIHLLVSSAFLFFFFHSTVTSL